MVLSVVRKTLAENDLIPSVSFKDGNAISSIDTKLSIWYSDMEKGYRGLRRVHLFFLSVQLYVQWTNNPMMPNIIGLDELTPSVSSTETPLPFHHLHQRTIAFFPAYGMFHCHRKKADPFGRRTINILSHRFQWIDDYRSARCSWTNSLWACTFKFQNSLPSIQQLLFLKRLRWAQATIRW